MQRDDCGRARVPSDGEVILLGRGYWVSRERRLLAGAYPGDVDPSDAARKLCQLDALGIEHILSLMEPGETDHQGRQFRPYEQEWQRRGHTVARFAVQDLTAPSSHQMHVILDHVDDQLDHGRGVLVHCWGGRGRTGTVVGCWLVRHAVATPALALTTLASLRGHCTDAHLDSPETSSQRRLVTSWRLGQ